MLVAAHHNSSCFLGNHIDNSLRTGSCAKTAAEISGCDIIDINMGCPAPKIAGNGDGSALMKDPALAGRIVEAVKKAVDLPVPAQFRKGWDKEKTRKIYEKLEKEKGQE